MNQACLHCGEASDGQEFCCLGCRTAYHLIRGAGLAAVYQQADRKWKPPQTPQGSPFDVFENPDYLNRRAPLGPDGLRRIELPLRGLMCSSCIWIVERLSHFVPHVVEARVDYGSSRVSLRFKDEPQVLSRTAEVLSQLGYTLEASELDLSAARIPKEEWVRLGITGLSAAGAMHIGLVLLGAHQTDMDSDNARLVGLFAGFAALPALTYGAWPFFRSAIQGLKLKTLPSDILVSLAVVVGAGASFYNAILGRIESYFDALSMVVFLLLAGRILVRLSTLTVVSRAVWWVRKGQSKIPADSLSVGDSFCVEENEIIALDGELMSESGWFDLSSLSGESAPVQIFKGQKLLQGSIARSRVELRVSNTVKQSYLEVLSQSLANNSWQILPPRYESCFTGFILVLSIFIFFALGQAGATKALALLIVTCPCALQLAYPLAVTAFRREAHQRGILILNPRRALAWKKVRDVYFDKTGTLTEGTPRLIHVESFGEKTLDEQDLNALVFGLASPSPHPLAKTLASAFAGKPKSNLSLQNVREVVGVGVQGQWKGTSYSLRRAEGLRGMASSLFVQDEERLRFLFEDSPRRGASSVLHSLQSNGLGIHLLSGDHFAECERFVSEVKVKFDSVRGHCGPKEKPQFQNSRTAFVGDGLNDALAMRAAGVSLGFSGSAEANLQAADAYLLDRDLNLVSQLRLLAIEFSDRIRINLGVSFLYNVGGIGLVLAGYLGPIVCAIFMPLSSLTVLLIAFRPLPGGWDPSKVRFRGFSNE